MKLLRSLLLITLLIIFCFQQWVVILVFNCNRQYVATNLCVNRKKVHNCCQGKCYLGKTLQKTADNSTEPNAQFKFKVEPFVGKQEGYVFEQKPLLIMNSFINYQLHFHPQEVNHSAFKPPQMKG